MGVFASPTACVNFQLFHCRGLLDNGDLERQRSPSANKFLWRRRGASAIGRIKHVYEKISKTLARNGIHKSSDQCRAKMKKPKTDYRKVKDKNGKTGRGRSIWKYFDALDAILGHRPATKPPLLLDTAAEEMIVASTIITTDAGESEEESEESPVDDGSSSITTTTTTTEGDDKLSSQANQKLSTGIRERPPKKTKEEKIESVMKNVVKDVVEAQQRSDEMFLKMEEKRMQYEADQKKQEREFQLQMMSMIYEISREHGS